ncbi:M48 family metalloprotease [Candidatus Poribacteria bacterium]|nr:M48 family metalloprotease [Candidatus Poribacteria bacterium]
MQLVKSGLYEGLEKKGYQFELRNELNEESVEYLSEITKNGIWFEDAYLEDFIQTILYKIHPQTLSDKRPGNLDIRIMQANSPNAFCLPSGSIVINTGLISVLDSEEELAAVLAHEVAHFLLDHHIININEQITREKRAAFWAAVATISASLVDAYLASQNEYYSPGALTISTAILANTLAYYVTERLGAKYSRAQEMEADHAATLILEYIGYNPIALSSALSKIEDYAESVGDYYSLSNEGTHPAVKIRINSIGPLEDNEFNDPKYHILVSSVNTHNAWIEYYSRHYSRCDQLVQQNIDAGIAMEEDYLLKAMVTRVLYDTPEQTEEAHGYIQMAKEIGVIELPEISKQEGITLLRLNRNAEAIDAFEKYLDYLSNTEKDTYIEKEEEWTKKMIYKTKTLKSNSL